LKTLHLIRHGETIWHAENRYAGITDVPLSEKGQSQAEGLRAWSTTAGLDAIMSSDLMRAEATARPVCEETGQSLVSHSSLREVNFGLCEGLTAAEMQEKFPEQRKAFERNPASDPLPEGEPGIEAITRALPTIHSVMENDGVNTALLVTHSTLARLLLCHFLGLELDRYRQVFPKLNNACLNTLRFPGGVDLDELRGSGSLLAYNSPI